MEGFLSSRRLGPRSFMDAGEAREVEHEPYSITPVTATA